MHSANRKFCCRHIPPTSPFTLCSFFFFNDTATTEIYTLSLHDALPIFASEHDCRTACRRPRLRREGHAKSARIGAARSEEHTSELQSPCNLVCRLLLEKKKLHMLSVPIRTRSTISTCSARIIRLEIRSA